MIVSISTRVCALILFFLLTPVSALTVYNKTPFLISFEPCFRTDAAPAAMQEEPGEIYFVTSGHNLVWDAPDGLNRPISASIRLLGRLQGIDYRMNPAVIADYCEVKFIPAKTTSITVDAKGCSVGKALDRR